jgi:hypothetical protein
MALNLTRLRCVTTPSVMLTEKLYMSDRIRLLSDLLALMSKSHDVATSALVRPAIHEGAPQRDFEIDCCEKNSGATEPPSVIPNDIERSPCHFRFTPKQRTMDGTGGMSEKGPGCVERFHTAWANCGLVRCSKRYPNRSSSGELAYSGKRSTTLEQARPAIIAAIPIA